MAYSQVDPVEAAKNIQLYFDQDGRYATEGFVSHGTAGHVYRIKTTTEAKTRRRIVKIPFGTDDDAAVPSRRNFLTEEAGLKALQAAMHVVNKLDTPDDPLGKPVPGGATSIVKGWVYMEWLENGTLEQFIRRAMGRSAPLPNRLIWRLLLCRKGSLPQWTVLLEVDMPSHQDSYCSVMFGHFPSDNLLEHELTPILKMIDLGGMERRSTPTSFAWDAAVQRLLEFLSQEIEPLLFAGRNPDFLLKYDPSLDLDLYRLIDPSMGSGEAEPMSLQYMEEVAADVILTRTAVWYRDNMPRSSLDETDEAVLRIIQELVLEPSKPKDTVADVMQALIEGIESLTI
ncbi:hypothetical protein PG993_014563 [Apiospora rasikravindrae]|uniref:Protein kinase domain-containing protein n=1 Tax=Apiospora rasikravindrae TaxID=990691 RepID=A0ABR1RN27_9PEZI